MENPSQASRITLQPRRIGSLFKEASILAQRKKQLELPVIYYSLSQWTVLLLGGSGPQVFMGRAQEFTHSRKLAGKISTQLFVTDLQKWQPAQQLSGLFRPPRRPRDIQKELSPT